MRRSTEDALSLLKSITGPEALMPGGRVEANARMRFTVAKALTQGRVTFDYQPVVRASAQDFAAFYEMMVRLRLPSGQVLPAAEFLPLVAEGPIGRAIDRLALEHALDALAADPALRISINLGAASMGDAVWLQMLQAASLTRPEACARLILEIDEADALEDTSQTIDFMNFVRGFGCAFALDHFGAGATGFRHFRGFRCDMVKIDGSFVQGISTSPDAQVLVECMMAVARHFEMFVIAERVEDQADADWLRAMGVDCLQGHLIAAPAATPRMPQNLRLVGQTATG